MGKTSSFVECRGNESVRFIAYHCAQHEATAFQSAWCDMNTDEAGVEAQGFPVTSYFHHQDTKGQVSRTCAYPFSQSGDNEVKRKLEAR